MRWIRRDTSAFRLLQRGVTFVLVNLSWLLFRAEGTRAAWAMLRQAVGNPLGGFALPVLDYALLLEEPKIRMQRPRMQWR